MIMFFFGGGDFLEKWSFFLKSGSYRTVLRDLLSCPTFCWGDLSKNDKIGPNGETVGGEFSGEIFTFFPKNGHFFMGDPLLGRTLFLSRFCLFCPTFRCRDRSKFEGIRKKVEFSRSPYPGEIFSKRHFFAFFDVFWHIG